LQEYEAARLIINMMSDTDPSISRFQRYKSKKIVRAAEIISVEPYGCLLVDARGNTVFRSYPSIEFTARYTPVVGDYWMFYEGNYESLSPKNAFVTGYDVI
jgi:hypothetical protein